MVSASSTMRARSPARPVRTRRTREPSGRRRLPRDHVRAPVRGDGASPAPRRRRCSRARRSSFHPGQTEPGSPPRQSRGFSERGRGARRPAARSAGRSRHATRCRRRSPRERPAASSGWNRVEAPFDQVTPVVVDDHDAYTRRHDRARFPTRAHPSETARVARQDCFAARPLREAPGVLDSPRRERRPVLERRCEGGCESARALGVGP